MQLHRITRLKLQIKTEDIVMKVGFIGIGSMGAVMVPNLVKAGHQVSVWNRSPEAAEALEGVTVLR
jgi:3-hydroxyisobutyrate dehydrogenase-like beta-hydroxyacid dehydrogenase